MLKISRIKFIKSCVNLILILAFLLVSFNFTQASSDDFDSDGVNNLDEETVYYTDPYKADTDGDGYSDWQELNSGFSPHNPVAISLKDNDQDSDGLSDFWELRFKTNLLNPDTDTDGYLDGEEINSGYDPLSSETAPLEKRIEIDTKNQELSYFLKGVRLNTFSISSGKNNSTPKGVYHVINKIDKAWSASYGLWMPYWLGLGTGRFGIHELPVWPSGYREGEDHLGTPVSHGCIRLGIGSAETLYDWSRVGTKVVIY
ncbi:MAG: L,D-transpeptidase family protein [Candidatus Pacebacteria bacterium]|nr:L,D-transpeptidase family protein [Candidatus Paceibacterota bacterium]